MQTAVQPSVPFGYTISVWAAGALMMNNQGIPAIADVALFASGALAGVRGGQLVCNRLGLANAWPQEVRFRTHVPALATALILAYAASELNTAAASWALTAASATGGYLCALGLAGSMMLGRSDG